MAASAAVLPWPEPRRHSTREAVSASRQIAQLTQGSRGRGPGSRLEQAAVVADQGGIGPVGFVAAQLGAADVLDLGRINDTDEVSGIVEMKRQAIAVASSCLQAGMHLVNPEILQPAQQSLPAFSVIADVWAQGPIRLARRRLFQFSATSNFCLAMSMPSQAVMAMSMFSEMFARSRGQCLLFVNFVRRVRCDPPQDTVQSDQQSMGSGAAISPPGFDAKTMHRLSAPLPQTGYDAPACKTNVQGR